MSFRGEKSQRTAEYAPESKKMARKVRGFFLPLNKTLKNDVKNCNFMENLILLQPKKLLFCHKNSKITQKNLKKQYKMTKKLKKIKFF